MPRQSWSPIGPVSLEPSRFFWHGLVEEIVEASGLDVGKKGAVFDAGEKIDDLVPEASQLFGVGMRHDVTVLVPMSKDKSLGTRGVQVESFHTSLPRPWLLAA